MKQLKGIITFAFGIQGSQVDNYIATMKAGGLIEADDTNTGNASKMVTINPLPKSGVAQEDTQRMARLAGLIRTEFAEPPT